MSAGVWIDAKVRLPETSARVLVQSRAGVFIAACEWDRAGRRRWRNGNTAISALRWMPIPEAPKKRQGGKP